jgi:Tol biopolymer transport system component
MNEDRLREALREEPLPDERDTEQRAWRLVQRAFAERPLRPAVRRTRTRLAAVAIAAVVAALVISPAGADVRHWIRDVVNPGHEPSRPALTSLPAPGRLLVESAKGPWVVSEDGSKRLLGDYGQSSWSPHGKYVAVTTRHELLAVEPDGDVHWSVARGGPIRDPSWSRPDGYRIAYLDGRDLRVIAGDGTGDRLLRANVSPVAPAWSPGLSHHLAFVAANGTVNAVAADTGRRLFRGPRVEHAEAVAWSAGGDRLLVVAGDRVLVLDRRGRVLRHIPVPRGTRITSAALAPDGRRIAVVTESGGGASSRLLVAGRGSGLKPIFSGPGAFGGVDWSPDGRWLLLAWRDADQWLFLQPGRARRIVAISNITSQFDPGARRSTTFPMVAGWCCAGRP